MWITRVEGKAFTHEVRWSGRSNRTHPSTSFFFFSNNERDDKKREKRERETLIAIPEWRDRDTVKRSANIRNPWNITVVLKRATRGGCLHLDYVFMGLYEERKGEGWSCNPSSITNIVLKRVIASNTVATLFNILFFRAKAWNKLIENSRRLFQDWSRERL